MNSWYNMPTQTTSGGMSNIQTQGAIEIQMSWGQVAELRPMLQRSLNSAIYSAAQRIERESAGLIPVRTGRLRDSLQVSVSGDSISLTLDPVDEQGHHYGQIVELGSPPHDIEGTNVPLSFSWHGQRVAFWHVHHPGYSGRGFLAQLKELMIAIVREEIGAAISREFMGAKMR